jgi:RHS repeat-associated protein
VMLFFLASCDEVNTKRQSAATLWERIDTVCFHVGIAAGPVLTTNVDGTLREERRHEPFGQPVNANVGGTIGPLDFRREQQNGLSKLTNPNTGWSYHGARWMQPQAARWTAPDPAVKGPAPAKLDPDKLNPYAYGQRATSSSANVGSPSIVRPVALLTHALPISPVVTML